jgi:hypothetical protein
VWKEDSELLDLLLEASVEREKEMDGGLSNVEAEVAVFC